MKYKYQSLKVETHQMSEPVVTWPLISKLPYKYRVISVESQHLKKEFIMPLTFALRFGWHPNWQSADFTRGVV